MFTVAIVNTIVILFAYLAKYKDCEFFLKVSFFCIFLFLALRYNYGNDYPGYLRGFLEVTNQTSIDYFDQESWHFEPGWLFLCRLFQPFGFFALVAVLAGFSCFVYYSFIKKHVSPNYYWFSVFIYVFNPGLMLINCSAMRQALATCLFLFSIDYIYKKDVIRYFLFIGIASLFHSSALILLPMYLFGLWDWKINKIAAISIVFLFILTLQFGSLIASYFNDLTSVLFNNRYEEYNNGKNENLIEIGSGLGVMFSITVLALIVLYDHIQTREKSFMFKISILNSLVIPFSLVINNIGRISLYLSPLIIVVFMAILISIKNMLLRYVFMVSIITITIYNFYVFFSSETYAVPFGTYNTIFSSPIIY